MTLRPTHHLLPAILLALAACHGAEGREAPGGPPAPEAAPSNAEATQQPAAATAAPAGAETTPTTANTEALAPHAPPTPEPTPPPETRPVFDLVANRHLAHREVAGGLLLDAGAPDFARYTHGNRDRDWVLGDSYDERAVAVPRNRTPSLYVPLTAEQAAAARTVRLELYYRSGRYPIDVSIGDVDLGEQTIAEGWQEVVFEVPEGALHAGENTLTLSLPSDATRTGSRTRGALHRVFIGPAAPPLGAVPEVDWHTSALTLAPDRRLAWYTELPPAAWLRIRPDQPVGAPCDLAVSVTTQSGQTSNYDVALSSGDPTHDLALEGAPSGEVVRLELGATGACERVALGEAALRTEGSEPVVPTLEPPRNVVIWLIDALRADRLRSINPDTRVIAPALDRIAREGVVFTRAYVQGNESFASHAALFSGRYPETMDVLSSADHVQDDEVLIAEEVRRAGLVTGGYSANGHINEGNGFLQGFDGFTNTLREHLRYQADGMLDHATRWVDAHRDERFYLYIGTVDTHVTYRTREDVLPLYDPDPYEGRFRNSVGGDELGEIKVGHIQVNDRDRFRIEAIYDNTITWGDRYFGQFLDHLEEMGLLDQTLIIVTADHGDEFWDHGSVGHGQSVYDELVHVPLLMRYPAGIPAGTVIHRGVDTVDVLPTLADLLGLPAPDGAQGGSLVPLIYGVGDDYPRPAFAQMRGRTHAMSLDHWKVLWESNGRRSLYDLRSDPTEQRDVGDENPYALRFVTDAMGLFMAYRDDWKKSEWGVASNLSPGFAP